MRSWTHTREAMVVLRSVRARFTGGKLEPLEPLDLEEGAEVSVTVDEQVHPTEEAEDAALARAIEDGLTTERVSLDETMSTLRAC